MKITDALIGEHAVLHALFDDIEEALETVTTAEAALELAGTLDAALRAHAAIEDELLFPALEKLIGPLGPMAVMHEEHHEIEDALDEALGAHELGEIVAAMRLALEIARPHFHKEEMVLFRLAVQGLQPAELDRLGTVWAKRRGVETTDDVVRATAPR